MDFMPHIAEITLTAILTTFGTFFVTRYTLAHSAARSDEARNNELDRLARYLAIRVVCTLDPFVNKCAEVAYDEGISDQDGYRHPQVDEPDLSIPEDVDWKSIEAKLMYRILSLPNALDAARQSVQFAENEITSPPDFDEYFEERVFQYGHLGLMALELADEIREIYEIAPLEYGSWQPKEIFEGAIKKVRAAQQRRQNFQIEL